MFIEFGNPILKINTLMWVQVLRQNQIWEIGQIHHYIDDTFYLMSQPQSQKSMRKITKFIELTGTYTYINEYRHPGVSEKKLVEIWMSSKNNVIKL